jgi:16S rRNA (adenine1518-N6/adenine1519-N6)-dimethyltransferase
MMNIPKKSLGQHWLRDLTTLEAIAAAADIRKSDTVLEVGPGLGTLTEVLLQQAKEVIAVELDSQLAQELRKNPAVNLQVVEQDILKMELPQLPPNYKVVANIPYYLTSNLIRVLTESPNKPKNIVLLVQKEVAERVAARPGKMSILAVSAQLHYEAELGVKVAAEMFTPPPKVDSQVIVLKRRPKPRFDKLDEQLFFQVVKAGFSEKRKMLRGSLSGGLRISKDDADRLLHDADISGTLRAEALSLAQWHRLYIQWAVRKNLRALL